MKKVISYILLSILIFGNIGNVGALSKNEKIMNEPTAKIGLIYPTLQNGIVEIEFNNIQENFIILSEDYPYNYQFGGVELSKAELGNGLISLKIPLLAKYNGTEYELTYKQFSFSKAKKLCNIKPKFVDYTINNKFGLDTYYGMKYSEPVFSVEGGYVGGQSIEYDTKVSKENYIFQADGMYNSQIVKKGDLAGKKIEDENLQLKIEDIDGGRISIDGKLPLDKINNKIQELVKKTKIIKEAKLDIKISGNYGIGSIEEFLTHYKSYNELIGDTNAIHNFNKYAELLNAYLNKYMYVQLYMTQTAFNTAMNVCTGNMYTSKSLMNTAKSGYIKNTSDTLGVEGIQYGYLKYTECILPNIYDEYLINKQEKEKYTNIIKGYQKILRSNISNLYTSDGVIFKDYTLTSQAIHDIQSKDLNTTNYFIHYQNMLELLSFMYDLDGLDALRNNSNNNWQPRIEEEWKKQTKINHAGYSELGGAGTVDIKLKFKPSGGIDINGTIGAQSKITNYNNKDFVNLDEGKIVRNVEFTQTAKISAGMGGLDYLLEKGLNKLSYEKIIKLEYILGVFDKGFDFFVGMEKSNKTDGTKIEDMIKFFTETKTQFTLKNIEDEKYKDLNRKIFIYSPFINTKNIEVYNKYDGKVSGAKGDGMINQIKIAYLSSYKNPPLGTKINIEYSKEFEDSILKQYVKEIGVPNIIKSLGNITKTSDKLLKIEKNLKDEIGENYKYIKPVFNIFMGKTENKYDGKFYGQRVYEPKNNTVSYSFVKKIDNSFFDGAIQQNNTKNEDISKDYEFYYVDEFVYDIKEDFKEDEVFKKKMNNIGEKIEEEQKIFYSDYKEKYIKKYIKKNYFVISKKSDPKEREIGFWKFALKSKIDTGKSFRFDVSESFYSDIIKDFIKVKIYNELNEQNLFASVQNQDAKEKIYNILATLFTTYYDENSFNFTDLKGEKFGSGTTILTNTKYLK